MNDDEKKPGTMSKDGATPAQEKEGTDSQEPKASESKKEANGTVPQDSDTPGQETAPTVNNNTNMGFDSGGGAQNNTIGTQQNQQINGGTVYSNFYSIRESDPDDKTGEDSPSKMPFVFEEFSATRSTVADLPRSQIAQFVDALMRDRILIIAGYWNNYMHMAAAALNHHPGFQHLQRRRCSIAGLCNWRDLVNKHEGWGKDMMLTVSMDDSNADILLDKLPYCEPDIEEVKKHLSDHHYFLILKVPMEALERKEKDAGPATESPNWIWKLDELHLFLCHHYQEKGESLYKSARDQITKGYWGKTSEEDTYRNALYAIAASHSSRELLDTLNMEPDESQAAEAKTRSQLEVTLKRGPLEELILFTGTFFPGLSYESFDKILRVLLACQLVESGEAGFDIERNDAIPLSVETSLTKRWERDADDLFDELDLAIRHDQDNNESIEFRKPQLRDLLRDAFLLKKGVFLRRQIDLIRYSKMVFFGNDKELDLITKLVLVTASHNPDYYCRAWLNDLVEGLDQMAAQENRPELEGDAAQIQQLFAFTLSESFHEYKIIGRITRIIQRFLLADDQRFEGPVNQFLDGLIHQSKYEQLLSIVKRLAKMRVIAPLFWMRQLLERGPKEMQGEILKYVVGFVINNKTNMLSQLQLIAKWLPNRNSPPAHYGTGQWCAARLMTQIFITLEMELIPNSCADEQDHTHPLWNNETDSGTCLVEVLFHPALSASLDKEEDQTLERKLWRVAFANGCLQTRIGKNGVQIHTDDIRKRQRDYMDSMGLQSSRSDVFKAVMIQRWCAPFLEDIHGAAQPIETIQLQQEIWQQIPCQSEAFFIHFWETANLAITAFWSCFQNSVINEVIRAEEEVRIFHEKVEHAYYQRLEQYSRTAEAFNSLEPKGENQ